MSGLKDPTRRLNDVRSPQEDTGELLHMVNYPQEGAQRGGHIPTAKSIPWATAANPDGTFKSADELRQIYGSKDITPDKDVVTYCRIGERSAHTWFVLTRLLGEGCTISSAAASYVTEITQGMTAEEVEQLSFEDLVEQLGRELVMTRPTCATLALGTLKKGVHEYTMHKRAEETH
ncbi:MAG: hypothetical protein NVS3B14_00260 [Ktedonobacteraceae bacterium]